ncbi:MAG: hypothetical protein JWM82_4430, partial [Myxococcales bacterium]|nr:hypothetical protein [Myxococcales bacterium]
MVRGVAGVLVVVLAFALVGCGGAERYTGVERGSTGSGSAGSTGVAGYSGGTGGDVPIPILPIGTGGAGDGGAGGSPGVAGAGVFIDAGAPDVLTDAFGGSGG